MTFSTHFNCIQGAEEIDGLDSDFDNGLAHSVLALACSAISKSLYLFMFFYNNVGQVSRALQLWKDGAISIALIQEAKGAGCAVKFKKEISKTTGKETTAHTAFSETFWKLATNCFLVSINQLDTEDMKLIIDEAKNATKSSRQSKNSSFTMHDDKKLQIVIQNRTDTSELESEN